MATKSSDRVIEGITARITRDSSHWSRKLYQSPHGRGPEPSSVSHRPVSVSRKQLGLDDASRMVGVNFAHRAVLGSAILSFAPNAATKRLVISASGGGPEFLNLRSSDSCHEPTASRDPLQLRMAAKWRFNGAAKPLRGEIKPDLAFNRSWSRRCSDPICVD